MGRLAVLPDDEDSDERCRTFVFQNENHTLGNVLHSIISQYSDVEFCGYTVPHPAEAKMHFRIQAKHNRRAIDILNRGLEDTEKVCEDVIDKFESSLKSHKDSKKAMDTS